MIDWFPPADAATGGSRWSLSLAGIIPMLGDNILSSHLHSMATSNLRLLPRILPGPSALARGIVTWQAEHFSGCSIDCCEGRSYSRRLDIGDRVQLRFPFPARWREMDPFEFRVFFLQRAETKAPCSGIIARGEPLISSLITIGLIVAACFTRDGPALIALAIFMAQSSLGFYLLGRMIKKSIYRLEPYQGVGRTKRYVIVTPLRSILVLETDDMLEDEIFEAVGDGKTLPGLGERILATKRPRSLGTMLGGLEVLFGLGVVALGASRFTSQVAIAAGFALLTALLWLVPPSTDTLSFGVNARELFPPGAREAHKSNSDLRPTEIQPTLCRTIWYAIREIGHGKWVQNTDIFPDSEESQLSWSAWIHQAEKNINDSSWPAQAEAERLINQNQQVYHVRQDSQTGITEREQPLDFLPLDPRQW